MIYIFGPGHGGPGMVANAYLEGTYSEVYPGISQDEGGMKRLFTQFSFPGGIPSHVAPETPGSIHEGGELGYALSHAYGAAFDNPDLIVAAVVGDGEAETGPLATSWHSNKFLNPVATARCCRSCISTATKSPIRPCLRASAMRSSKRFFAATATRPTSSRATIPRHARADGGDARGRDRRDPSASRRTRGSNGFSKRPLWPMIVMRTPKGWTCPKEIDGKREEGTGARTRCR